MAAERRPTAGQRRSRSSPTSPFAVWLFFETPAGTSPRPPAPSEPVARRFKFLFGVSFKSGKSVFGTSFRLTCGRGGGGSW